MKNFSKELDSALFASKEAAKILNKFYSKKIGFALKSDGTPVTEADKLAEKKIVSILSKKFPSYGFLGEETGEKGNREIRWIVDPLDGTKNFVKKIPYFGSLIALEKHGEIVSGVLSMPVFNEFVFAEKGKGCYLNGKKIQVSSVSELSEAVVVFGGLKYFLKKDCIEQLEQLISLTMHERGFGDLLGYSLICQGKADIVVEAEVNPWDIAAAKILIEESGGKFSDFNGEKSIYSGNCIASNGKLHDNVLEIFSK